MKRPLENLLVAAAVICLGFALYSGAWFSDDALRLWRISFNWLGFGSPDFNAGQRVLGFEQPFWVVLLSAGTACSGRPAATAVVLQFLLFCGGTCLLWACHRQASPAGQGRAKLVQNAAKVAVVACLLGMSNCFREYMASGLEYALSYFLVAFVAYLACSTAGGVEGGGPSPRKLALIVAAAALLVATRYSLIWALAPAALFLGWRWRQSVGRHWLSVALGLSPLALWLIFAWVHFGSVSSGREEIAMASTLPRLDAITHGKLYLVSGLIQEPITFLLALLGLIAGAYATWRMRGASLSFAFGVGAAAYLLFIVWHGGDSVGGRMFVPVAIFSAAAIACAPAFPVPVYVFLACYVLIFFNLKKVSLLTGAASRVPRTVELFREWGVADDYLRQVARPKGTWTKLSAYRLGLWSIPATGATDANKPLLTSSPGWDGLVAGPGRVVEDWRSMGPARPELAGAVSASVNFSAATPGTLEPLLSFGEPGEGTLLMAEHLHGGGLRFQVWRPGTIPVFSRALRRLDVGFPHRLLVKYGSAAAGRETQGRFAVVMDGKMLLDVNRAMRRYNFDEVVAGWNVEGNTACLPAFPGSITSLSAPEPGEIEHDTSAQPLEKRSLIDVRIRFSMLANSAEPIVSVGEGEAGDITFVRRIGDGRVVFGQVHWGQDPQMGPIVDADDRAVHHIQVAVGPIFTSGDAIVRPDCVRVTMDGKTVLESRQELYPFKPTDVYILDNPLAGSFCGRDFLGEIVDERTVTLQPLVDSASKVLRENTGPVSMRLRFDGSLRGRGLGILEAGVRGAGDIVYVVADDASHVRFFYDHWGYGGISGREVEIDPAKVYVLKIEMGSLSSPDDGRPDHLTLDRLMLDGQVVLEGSSPSAAGKGSPLRILENSLSSSNVAEPFDGTCLGVSRGQASVSFAY